MSKSRREEAHHILSHVRIELREMSLYLKEEKVLPESGEIKVALLESNPDIEK